MLRRFQNLFDKVVHSLEDNPAPLGRYFILFFAILAVRLTLEFFSNHRLFTGEDILHIGLWFIFIVLAFLLQLHLFSGEKIIKVGKLVVVCFSLALSAPIIDLIVSKGVGSSMNYLTINNWRDVFHAYYTVGGSSLIRGATIGIRIEIVLLVLAAFNYIRVKSGSVIRAALGAWCIYTVLFISGAIPALLGALVNAFHLKYQHGDQSTVLLLLTLDLFLLFWIFFFHSPGRMIAMLKSIPAGAVILFISVFVLGARMADQMYPDNWSFTPTTLFHFPLLVAIAICLAVYAGIWRQRKEIEADLRRNQKIGGGLMILILGVSALLSIQIMFSFALIWGLLFLLVEPPLELRRIPILRNILEAVLLVAVLLAGFCCFGGIMVGFPNDWLLFLLLFATSCVFTDIRRTSGDSIPWYSSWKPNFQLGFRILSAMVLGIWAILLGWMMPMETSFPISLCLCFVPAIGIILWNRLSQGWILLSLSPVFFWLATHL